MRSLATYLLLALSLVAATSRAQLSPGDLTTAHANLEGMSNCTQCHDLGNKVTNAKCLECHKEIKSLITQKKGYHASKDVKAKDCFTCHSEHHGRKFEMVRFDEKTFDHGLTGYKLEGAHKPVDCRECHLPDNIADKELKKRDKTFLGMDQKCLSCHDDFHQGTMDKDCLKCHSMTAWKPASVFDHNKTDFPLKGKHIPVDCKECHAITTKNGKQFQAFGDVPHTDCKACHDDPHNAHFTNACAQCHTETAFSTFAGKDRFDHNTTPFKLNGKHKTTDCFECHKRTSDPLTVFEDRAGVAMNQCVTCHKDQHDGKFGTDCAKCHQEKGWVAVKSMDFFDHNVTDFPLQGKHVAVDCKKCHKGRYTDPIVFVACNSCHADFHKGEFAENGASPDCVECHFLTDGFEVSMYSLEQHATTKFPLDGAHVATPCSECHLNEKWKKGAEKTTGEKWKFRSMAMACADCHDNVHGEEFALAGVTDCKRCHVTGDWFPSGFDHSKTAFPLDGEHKNVDCKECHKNPAEGEKKLGSFKIAKYQCIDCHK
ncbi:MAG: hypothetical protein KA230_02020 [Flavobacteriales bacterium]|nr:hypothetical protein [Flavobacteriales bacterium]